jgi:hypothetical protein
MQRIVTVSLAALLVTLSFAESAHAGIGKWFRREFVPTITGKRPLKIKPYVSVKHRGKLRFRISRNSVYVKVGGVTVKTHQLMKRLAQVGCVIETGGNVVACAPDVIAREARRLAQSAQVRPSTHVRYPDQVSKIRPMGWARYRPAIVARCQLRGGVRLGLTAGGYIRNGMTTVGMVRRSMHPAFRFVLTNGRGFVLPVDHAGRVIGRDRWGRPMLVGFCR